MMVFYIEIILCHLTQQNFSLSDVDIGLNQNTYTGIEGTNITVCAEILNGTIERTVSVYLFTANSTAHGNLFDN